MTYQAPLQEMRFVLNELAGLAEVAGLPGYEEASPDLVEAILDEAGKLAAEVLAPLNHSGDRDGAVFENGVVRSPHGFQEAYDTYRQGRWASLPFDPDYGGQGLPWVVAIAVQEMLQSANMGFGLCPLLAQGTVELLQQHGSDEQKELYLPKLISGEWTGTMNLTEPQAGSDVGALKTRAVRNGDHYLISGQKIYITYGEHDLTDNIIHMVLARTPDAPAGTKGISLFIVPKFLLREDGAPGVRNDLRCVSIEHKLGVRASPTAVMAYGDSGGAVGFLVGEENRGMEYMFTMMNNARLSVGVQGVAIAERAYQQALAFAKERVQSRALAGADSKPVRIIEHPDVRRMLMTMKASTEAVRALSYFAAAALDLSKRHPDAEQRARQDALFQLLTPVAKAWCTDVGCEVASLGVQIHGGLGYIEETGAAQHYRDARILPIYEGTNGIQALDLLGRKLLRDGGKTMQSLIADMDGTAADLADNANEELRVLGAMLAPAVKTFAATTGWLLEAASQDLQRGAAGATAYQAAFGLLVGGWLLSKSALAAATHRPNGVGFDPAYLEAKLTTARFYLETLLPRAFAHCSAVTQGAESTLSLSEAQF